MNVFRTKWLVAAAVAAITTLGLAPSAEAAFKLKLTQGATVVEIEDGDAGDANGAAGAITFIGSVGVFTVNVTTGLADPVLDLYNIDLNSVNATTTTGGTLTIDLTRTDYPAAVGLTGLHADIGGTTTGSVSYKFGYDIGDGDYSFASGSGTGNSPFGPGAFSDSESIAADLTDPDGDGFSISLQATIVHSGAGNSSFDLDVSPLPVPGGIVLALSALPVLGVGYLRRRKLKVA